MIISQDFHQIHSVFLPSKVVYLVWDEDGTEATTNKAKT